MPKKDSFEYFLKEAETAIEQMESGTLPLEEAIATYERGVAALKKCHAILEGAEQKVEQLIADKDGAVRKKKG